MKKKLLVLLLGCTPFLLGRIQDFLMINLMWFPPLLLLNVLMLLLWAFFSKCSLNLLNGDKQALLLLNTPAAVVLIFVIIQEWLFGAYWMNLIGLYSQLFYLPFLGLGFRLTFWSYTVPAAYIAAFLCMILTSVLVYKHKNT